MISSVMMFAALAVLGGAAAPPAEEVRRVLTEQMDAWNRGDLAGFASGYLNSPDLVFIGKTVARGHEQMLERYRKAYPTPEKMGKLRFSDIEVRMLDERYANVIGHFHLQRTALGGGDAEGIFTLLFQKTPSGWKIIQDHTS